MQSLIFAGLAYVIAYFVYGKAEFMDLGVFMIPAKYAPYLCAIVTGLIFMKAPQIKWPESWPQLQLLHPSLPDTFVLKPAKKTDSGIVDLNAMLSTILALEIQEAKLKSADGLAALDTLRKVALERMKNA